MFPGEKTYPLALVAGLFIITILFGSLIAYQQMQIRFLDQLLHPGPVQIVDHDQISGSDVRIARLEKRVDELTYPSIDFYAYGDSLTNNPDNYLVQMARDHSPGSVVLFNDDGSGRTSRWGAEYIGEHYRNNTRFFVYMFTNDGHSRTTEETIQNYLKIYDYATERGSIAVPCIPVLTSRNWSRAYDQANQTARILALEAALDARGIWYVKLYDALDSQSGNGRPDDINITDIPDGSHPDTSGHKKLGEYLWRRLAEKYGPI